MKTAYYSKSLESFDNLGLTHYYDSGDKTLCGIKFTSPRWVINNSRCTCKKCIKKYKELKGNTVEECECEDPLPLDYGEEFFVCGNCGGSIEMEQCGCGGTIINEVCNSCNKDKNK